MRERAVGREREAGGRKGIADLRLPIFDLKDPTVRKAKSQIENGADCRLDSSNTTPQASPPSNVRPRPNGREASQIEHHSQRLVHFLHAGRRQGSCEIG